MECGESSTTPETQPGMDVESDGTVDSDCSDEASGTPVSGGTVRTTSCGWITKFTIPVQPATITSKLKHGGDGLNNAERGLFLESIYSAVTKKHKIYYPTKSDYNIIVDKMFTKFPKMSRPASNMPLGDKKCLWKQRLLYKFQNQRRRGDMEIEAVQRKKRKQERKVRSSEPAAVKPQTYWGLANYLPDRPASEDDASIEAHIKWLVSERKKKQPDYKTVACSMGKTLADRRKWLMSATEKPSLKELQEKYPWIFEEDQMSEEMQRMKGDDVPLQAQLHDGLEKYGAALTKRCRGRRAPPKYFAEIMAAIPLMQAQKQKQEATLQAAFISIPGLFKEKISDILIPAGKTTANSARSHVYIQMDADTPCASEKFTLIVDGKDVAISSTLLGAATLWIEAFYVFNLGYPACLSSSLTFLQRVILMIDDQLPVAKAIRMQVNLLNAT